VGCGKGRVGREGKLSLQEKDSFQLGGGGTREKRQVNCMDIKNWLMDLEENISTLARRDSLKAAYEGDTWGRTPKGVDPLRRSGLSLQPDATRKGQMARSRGEGKERRRW